LYAMCQNVRTASGFDQHVADFSNMYRFPQTCRGRGAGNWRLEAGSWWRTTPQQPPQERMWELSDPGRKVGEPLSTRTLWVKWLKGPAEPSTPFLGPLAKYRVLSRELPKVKVTMSDGNHICATFWQADSSRHSMFRHPLECS